MRLPTYTPLRRYTQQQQQIAGKYPVIILAMRSKYKWFCR